MNLFDKFGAYIGKMKYVGPLTCVCNELLID